ncbi:hypothetical protein M758_UG033800 [Ceratodon purpureus]|nr:hypothetical protein M758_UG033800 [Ceratodon purpureus]
MRFVMLGGISLSGASREITVSLGVGFFGGRLAAFCVFFAGDLGKDSGRIQQVRTGDAGDAGEELPGFGDAGVLGDDGTISPHRVLAAGVSWELGAVAVFAG